MAQKKWIVFIEKGNTQLMSPNGEVVFDELSGTLLSSANKNENEYTATFLVDVVNNRAAALNKVKDNN
jgi:hypothetical protein